MFQLLKRNNIIVVRRLLRWLGFILALISVIILTSFKDLQSFGWFVSSLSCMIWAYDSYKSRHTPRFFMECLYTACAVWGVVNWLG